MPKVFHGNRTIWLLVVKPAVGTVILKSKMGSMVLELYFVKHVVGHNGIYGAQSMTSPLDVQTTTTRRKQTAFDFLMPGCLCTGILIHIVYQCTESST